MRKHVSMLCAGLAERGHSITVAAPSDFRLETQHAGVTCVIVQISAHTRPVADIRAGIAVAKLTRKADVVHGHGLRGAWIASLAARRARKPFVFTAHNLVPETMGWLPRRALRYVTDRASAIIAVSKAVVVSLQPYTGRPIDVIPNGIDLTQFDDSHTPTLPHSHTVLSVGRLSPEKGFHVLIEAVPQVLKQFPDTRLVIAGEGPERERLEKMIVDRGLAEHVKLPGYVSDVPGLLLASDVVAIPSLSEGQGIVALEAMAARKAVVASRVGGLEETVKSGITGLLVKPGDPGELAFAVCSFLGDTKAVERMGQAGREIVEKDYTLETMLARTVELYNRVLAV